MSRFVGNPQRLIVLEGTPEVGIADLARQVRQRAGRGIIMNLPGNPQDRDWTPREFVDDIRQILVEKPQELIVFTQFTVPERLRHRLEEPNPLSELELYLGQLPTYAFFLKATTGYYTRHLGDLDQALRATQRQVAYEQAYQSTRHSRKLMLGADGCTHLRLAETILFQADLIVRDADPDGPGLDL